MRRSRSRQSRSERRIEPSGEGRISFRPGDKHPLDVQFKEARRAKEQLAEQLEHFTELLHALVPPEEIADRFEAEDEALRHYLVERYQDYFHVDHIEATFLWLRRRRAIARLQAAQAALGLDLPVVQAITMIITIMVLVANVGLDLVYALLDPRVRIS